MNVGELLGTIKNELMMELLATDASKEEYQNGLIKSINTVEEYERKYGSLEIKDKEYRGGYYD